MRTGLIKVGSAYTGEDETEVRVVSAIGMHVRPGTALTPGVEFIEGESEPFLIRRLYLDTFAQWARKEIV